MSASSLHLRWRRLARLWPLTFISVGIIASFVWAALLAWLIVCAIAGLI